MINYSLDYKKIGTGSSYGAIAEDHHAAKAVEAAVAKIEPNSTIGSVLLFLSSAYSHAPHGAIKLAAKVAGTPQVFGCGHGFSQGNGIATLASDGATRNSAQRGIDPSLS